LIFAVNQRLKTAEFNYWLLLSLANWSKSDDDDAVHKLCSNNWQTADC